MISTKGIKPEVRNFHNTPIPVYPRTIKLEEINYWKENYRTILQFDLLSSELKKPLSRISTAEVVNFLAKQKVLEISRLAESIKNNDVKIPLVVLEDGELLDGNRRYFACYYLKLQAEKSNSTRPDILDRIPVWVIKHKDINQIKKLKILAEANFVYPNKVDWTDDVKAKVVNEYYEKCMAKGIKEEEAFSEIKNVYSVQKQMAKDYIDTVKLTKQFINSATSDSRRNALRSIVQHKFVYFWEYKNKSSNLNKEESRKVKKLFFIALKNGQLNNIKLIEPMIWAVGDADLWKTLEESRGGKLRQIEAGFKEERAIRSAEDKISNFMQWVSKKLKSDSLDTSAYNLVVKLSNLIDKYIKNREKQ